MKLLLDDRLAPITSEIGFLEMACAEAARGCFDWQKSIAPSGVQLSMRKISEQSLEKTLRRLLPLTSVMPTRVLFVGTPGPWTAFFTNSAKGSDANAPMCFLARNLRVRGLRVTAVPNTWNRKSGRFGATILEIFGPANREFLNYIRSIGAANDGGRWRFDANGEVQPFEEPSAYDAKLVRDRFTPEMLDRYVTALGVRPFSEDSYLSSDVRLIEKTGPYVRDLREYSLEVARQTF